MSLLPAIDPVTDRSAALARLAEAAAAVAHKTKQPFDPAWTRRSLIKLLATDSWSYAAPALARLDPDAFTALKTWIVQRLDLRN